MAKNFGKAGSVKKFKEVAKASAEKAQVIVVKMIRNEYLVDYPKNFEDIQDTLDLENSIRELGFSDPIEVTTFGQPAGKYMIVSGHRRRSAGVKCGMDTFPCIVKPFNSDAEVNNYVLLANSQRDSAKDPLLFCKRYKMHEEYLKSINFTGKMRDEIAKRLGISVPQADRYNAINKVIIQVWDMIRDEVVGMSSVLPMASHAPEEQIEIYNIMQEALQMGVNLTRGTVKQIVDSYREGKRSWDEIVHVTKQNQSTTKIVDQVDVSNEDNDQLSSSETEVRGNEDQASTEKIENQDADSKDKKELTDIEKQAKRAKHIQKDLEKLSNYLSDIYTFESAKEAEETMRNMASTFNIIIDEMYNIAREHNLGELFKHSIEDMKAKVTKY